MSKKARNLKKATKLNETSFLKSAAHFPPKPRLKSRVHRQGPSAAWKRPSEHTAGWPTCEKSDLPRSTLPFQTEGWSGQRDRRQLAPSVQVENLVADHCTTMSQIGVGSEQAEG